MPFEANTEVKMIPEFSPRYDVYPMAPVHGGLIFLPVPEVGPMKTARKSSAIIRIKTVSDKINDLKQNS